jgi:uncharacterized membrane protein YhaH (DUF805 family)
MSPARKAFFWVFLACLAIGIVIGVMKLVAPDSASVTLNGEEVTGMTALITSGAIGGGLGLFFGLIIAGIVKLATRGSKKAT